MLQFNTGKKLEKVFPPDQFDALIDFLEDYNGMAATKSDVRESELRLQLEIEKVRAELKTDIEKVRAELKTDIEKVRAEVKETEARLTEKLESNKHEILKWITGMVVAQAAVFVALAGVAVGLVAFYPK